MDVFLAIVGTGIPGFLSYWYLSKLGLLEFDKDRKDEKIIALASLSALNVFLTVMSYAGFIYATRKKSCRFQSSIAIANFLGVCFRCCYKLFYDKGSVPKAD